MIDEPLLKQHVLHASKTIDADLLADQILGLCDVGGFGGQHADFIWRRVVVARGEDHEVEPAVDRLQEGGGRGRRDLCGVRHDAGHRRVALVDRRHRDIQAVRLEEPLVLGHVGIQKVAGGNVDQRDLRRLDGSERGRHTHREAKKKCQRASQYVHDEILWMIRQTD